MDHDILSNIDIKDSIIKLRNDIEKLKDDLIEKNSALKTADEKLLEMTNLLNDEKDNTTKLESRIVELNLYSETIKNERDSAIKEVELKNRRLLVVNERKHEEESPLPNNNEIGIALNDFVDNYPTETEMVDSTVDHDLKSKENDIEMMKIQERNNDLTEQINKLKGDLDNADKLQRILGKEREMMLSQTIKLQGEIENAKQIEEALRKDNANVLQQLKRASADLEVATKLEQERIVNATELEKRYWI